MDELKIDKGIPMPARSTGAAAVFRKLEIGDSVFSTEWNRAGLSNQAKQVGIKITMRSVTEDGVKGVRVWRVE